MDKDLPGGETVKALIQLHGRATLVTVDETRRELGPALRLPSPPWAMALSQHGELVVCFGADTALVTLDD